MYIFLSYPNSKFKYTLYESLRNNIKKNYIFKLLSIYMIILFMYLSGEVFIQPYTFTFVLQESHSKIDF